MCLCGICLRPARSTEFLFSYSESRVLSSVFSVLFFMDFELRIMSYRKSVFFARLKRWMACLWPSGGRRRILRLSLLKKQDVSSTPCRAKTVLTRVKKISVSSLWLKIFQPKILNYAKQTQFPKCQKCLNLSKYKELQWTMSCELLCKTNPIKPNLSYGQGLLW